MNKNKKSNKEVFCFIIFYVSIARVLPKLAPECVPRIWSPLLYSHMLTALLDEPQANKFC